MVQPTQTEGFDTWHAIAAKCDQKNMSDKKSALTMVISNISERNRAKDVEAFDDILKALIEANKFEDQFGEIRDEKKMLGIKKLMLETPLNFQNPRND